MKIEIFPSDGKGLVSLYSNGWAIGEACYHPDTDTWDYDTFTPAGRRAHVGEFNSLEEIIERES